MLCDSAVNICWGQLILNRDRKFRIKTVLPVQFGIVSIAVANDAFSFATSNLIVVLLERLAKKKLIGVFTFECMI